MTPFRPADAPAFAADWAAAWNSRDLDRILAHYAEGIVFRSLKAIPLTGAGEVRGRAALRAYWAAALARQPDLRFEVTSVFAGHDTLVIVYRNHAGVTAAETLRFGPTGEVAEASACHPPPAG
ncbi:MAG: nuclear transport factor 2 family protein [Pseudomonadota bacterium]|nr:nuclear transport factor 2 family protein [Pseudomonadota bacterium]MEE3101536.1 nuclear transport factor 2 family protein [Pseudomonadota bacterium]